MSCEPERVTAYVDGALDDGGARGGRGPPRGMRRPAASRSRPSASCGRGSAAWPGPSPGRGFEAQVRSALRARAALARLRGSLPAGRGRSSAGAWVRGTPRLRGLRAGPRPRALLRHGQPARQGLERATPRRSRPGSRSRGPACRAPRGRGRPRPRGRAATVRSSTAPSPTSTTRAETARSRSSSCRARSASTAPTRAGGARPRPCACSSRREPRWPSCRRNARDVRGLRARVRARPSAAPPLRRSPPLSLARLDHSGPGL